MKPRVIFVGVHNKPGKTPLDSSTLTGRTVDAIASLLPEFEIVKSNLHDMEYLPTDRLMTVTSWRRRVKYKRDDIVVVLGRQVGWDFGRNHGSQIPIPFIQMEHPAKVMSSVERARYIQNAVEVIKNRVKL